MSETFRPTVYRDVWADELRLVIGNNDVTRHRGVPTEYAGYQLTEPYGYGPADFRFPAITGFEADKLGAQAPLRFVRHGQLARLTPIKDGVRGRDVWRGIVTIIRVTDGHLEVHCDGEASGRLSLRDRHPAIFWLEKDIGDFISEAFDHCGLPFHPKHGPTTGVLSENRGGGTDYLQWVDQHLADAITTDLDQWTVAPTWVNDHHTYELRLKDTITVDATVFYGAHGVTEDLASDLQEEPNTWFGTGIRPDGMKWNNAVVPGLEQAPAPKYPFNDGRVFGLGTSNQDTDLDAGISIMHWMLIGRGYLDKDDAGGTFDIDTEHAVADLQQDAGLPVMGSMTPATWDALYDLSVVGLNIRQARILPLAQASRVRKWNVTASGALASRNPDYDPGSVAVDRTIDHGPGVRMGRARRWSNRQLRRVENGKNWVGTIELDGADVFAGVAHHGDTNLTPMSARDLRPGVNLMLRGFDGDTLFHVGGINVGGDGRVRLAVDTNGRDLRTVGEIIARRKQSRSHPAREWKQNFRSRSFSDAMIVWTRIGGLVNVPVPVPAGEWTVFPVIAGQSGTLEWLRVELSEPSEFAMAIFAEGGPRRLKAGLNRLVGDPFNVPEGGEAEWTRPRVQNQLRRQYSCLYAVGEKDQPCGYSPGQKTDDRGRDTGDRMTGMWQDEAGINFHTFAKPVLYVAIWRKPGSGAGVTVEPGRMMWLLQTEGF